jgi:hypothetical protein
MNFSQFKSEVYSAMVDGDTHAVPQVEAAAKALRAQVMDPVKGYLSSVKDMNGQALMGDVIEPPKGDKSFAPRFWSKEAIGRDPNRFDSIVSNWLSKQQANKASIQTRLRGLNDQLSWLNDRNKWLNARIEGRRTALEAATNRSEEISRMNQFAYRRSAQLSQPLDDLRQKVRGIQATVQPHLDKLEQLAKDIKAERAGLPGVTGADTALWRLIGANQRLKDAGDIVSTLEGAHEYQDEVQRVIGGFKEGIRGAREQAVGARNQPEAATLAALEKSRADIRKEIAPYIKELNKARKDIGRIEGQRVPGARGGAVFETEIRNRGNVLADRMAGKRDQLNHFTEELGRRNAELADVRKAVEEEVTKWEGNTSAEAKAALKIREKYEAERAAKVLAGTFKGADPTARLTSADAAIDKTVRAILEAPTDLSAEEIMSRAREIRHRIDTDPDGRLPYDEPKADPHGGWASSSDDLRGSLNRRAFAIPTKDVLDFVHTDLEHVIPAYLKNVVPDAMHIERFGDLRATIPQKRINEFYDAQIAKAPTKELAAKIDAKRKRELADVVGMRDRYRGVYGLPTTAWQRNLGRVSRAVMQYNAITMLGSSVLNRLQDVANAVSRRGMLGYMGDGFLPMIGALTRLSKSGQAARDMVKGWGIGVDTAMGHMATSFSDITNDHLPGNRFERGLQTATKGSMWLNLHGPWTDGWRQVAAMAASADHLRSIERIVNGTATERDVRMMAWSGIDQPMAAKIWDNFQNGHTEVNGVKLPNTADWDPAAERAFVNAVRKEANTAVAQPGQERPFLFDHPMGRAALQFRSFEYAAWHKIMLSNLQMGDGRALQGMLSMLAMGALSAWAYSVASGRVEQMTGWSPQDWVKEALLRSGMLGPFSTMNTLQAKLTNGKTDIFRAIGTGKPPQRRDQTNAVEDALGPTFKEAMGLGMAIPHVFSNTTTARDVNNARQTFIPLQNYMFFRRLLDEAEDNFDRHWGIRPMNRNPKAYPGMWTTPQ